MKIIDETTIQANVGMVLTNGKTFGIIVYLGKNDSVDNWYEITEEEAERLRNEENESIDNETTEADYINALS